MKTIDLLTNLSPATIAALAKLASDAAKANRDQLEEGTHGVDTIVTLVLDAEVKVLADQENVSTPQKARPWAIIHVLLEEVSKLRSAAGEAGLDLAKLVEMAEKVDDRLAKTAQKAADAETAALKEPTKQSRKGQVKVKGTCRMPEAA